MGNILQDMMGLLSRKKVVKEVESTDFILLGRTPNPEDSMFVNPKMNNQLITIKDLKAHFDEGEISGGGTVNTVPIFTPDGTTLGDSIISQDASGTRIGIGSTNPQRELDVFGGIRVRGPLDLFQQDDNSFAGQDAGNWYNITGSKNTAFGKNSQKNQGIGSQNTSVGYESMAAATAGNLNVAVGNSAMLLNNGGSFNTAIGAGALQDQEAGQGNTAIGYDSLNNKEESNFNTALGYKSLFNMSTGFKNIGIGDNVGSTLSTGTKNVLIGSNADVQSSNNINSIVIGESAIGAGSNTVTLGDNNITDTYLKGNVIIPATITAGGSIGTAGQVLSSTGTGVEWVNAQSGALTQTTGTVTPTLTAGISGLTYLVQDGYWTRIGDIVSVFIDINIGTFTKTDPNIRLTIDDVFPYDIDNSRFFFNSDIMRYTNISNGGVAIPAIYVLKPEITGSYPYSIFFGQSSNYSLGSGNYIITDNMSTGGFNIWFSFTYKATGNTLRAGATID